MNYTIENEYLSVQISSLGAEVLSVKDIKTGKELWWNGDPAYWHGHSPILFPACGGLWNGKYIYNGKEYDMPKHGFAKRMEWQACPQPSELSHGTQDILFELDDNEETFGIYPFHWHLTISYALVGKQLLCKASVRNNGDETMHYQLGGHPAIALPDYPFENKETITPETTIGYLRPQSVSRYMVAEKLSVVRATEQGCWEPERYRVNISEKNGMIPISMSTFHNEALIFDSDQVHGFKLYRADGVTSLAEVFFDSPACLVWQMQDLLCPYVCVEPWYGLPDRNGCTMPLDYRPYTLHTMQHDEDTHFLWGIRFT